MFWQIFILSNCLFLKNNRGVKRYLVNITLTPKWWISSAHAPCFEISKMWSAGFVPKELTEILINKFKFCKNKYNPQCCLNI